MQKLLILAASLFIGLTNAESFNRQYELEIYGQSAGEATLRYDIKTSTANNGSYQASLNLKPNGLAELFGGEAIDETVNGQIKDTTFYPQKHSQTYQSSSDKNNVTEFNGERIIYTDENETLDLKVDYLVQDTLSLILQIQQDLKTQHLKPHYYLISGKRIRGYEAQSAPQDEHTIITLKQLKSGKRVIQLTFNNKQELVTLEKQKSGKSQFIIRNNN